jgi:hypothetical protein
VKVWFVTRIISTITSRKAYLGLDSRESSHSQQNAHEENKSANNGYKFAWEGVNSLGWGG